MQKRGQAALEFLTTYGWAFLVILIMIGALAYFGILKPSRLLPERCTFGSEIGCQDFGLDTVNGNVTLRLKNSVGDTIIIDNINFTSESRIPFKCDGTRTYAPSATMPNGGIIDFQVGTCNYAEAGMVSGEKGKISVTVSYYTAKSGPTYMHNIQGEVYATVR